MAVGTRYILFTLYSETGKITIHGSAERNQYIDYIDLYYIEYIDSAKT